jgi:hypothetical protein
VLRRRIWLFLIAFLVYNLNLRPIPAGHTSPAALLPFTILADHTLTFDRFAAWYQQSQQMVPVWFARGRDGHYYSEYPIALPLLLTRLFAAGCVPGYRTHARCEAGITHQNSRKVQYVDDSGSVRYGFLDPGGVRYGRASGVAGDELSMPSLRKREVRPVRLFGSTSERIRDYPDALVSG